MSGDVKIAPQNFQETNYKKLYETTDAPVSIVSFFRFLILFLELIKRRVGPGFEGEMSIMEKAMGGM